MRFSRRGGFFYFLNFSVTPVNEDFGYSQQCCNLAGSYCFAQESGVLVIFDVVRYEARGGEERFKMLGVFV